jgi:hypothetical protein
VRRTLKLRVPKPDGAEPQVARAPLDGDTVMRLRAVAATVPSRRDPATGTFQVYIALLQGVPGASPPSLYVGMTGLTPDERYLNHQGGYKSGKGWIKRYGIGLLPQLVIRLNPMSWADAMAVEAELLMRLRRAGFDVHGA